MNNIKSTNAFFSPTENFQAIINKTLNSSATISPISTGWTNIVFKAKTNFSEYIFRFPRSDFWSKVLVHECTFNDYFTQNFELVTPKLSLCYDNARPFTFHKFIHGKTLASCFKVLKKSEKLLIAKQLANFLIKFQSLDFASIPVKLQTTSQFLHELSQIEHTDYDLSQHDFLITQEQTQPLVLTHGDLNADNILIDNNNNVCQILDFAFVSLSAREVDIARLCSRLPQNFAMLVLSEYNSIASKKVLRNHAAQARKKHAIQSNLSKNMALSNASIKNITLQKARKKNVVKIAKVYRYVDKKYLEFIKKHYPEIEL